MSQPFSGLAQSQAPDGLAPGLTLPSPLPSGTTSRDLSRSATFTSDDSSEQHSGVVSPNKTLTDLNAGIEKSKGSSIPQIPTESTITAEAKELGVKGEIVPKHVSTALSSLPSGRKSILLFCFCLAMFIDAAGVSATFLMTAPIAHDLHITFANEAWILGTYSMVFAACLLFAGRLADLYPPHLVYITGFVGISIFYLIISFMTNEYAFYVLRAFSALLAVLTIPASINMIVQMYPDPTEQAKKLGLFGMSGALANTIALVLSGLFMIGHSTWRWWFRFVAILVAPFAVIAWFIMPKTEAVAEDLGGFDKWKRMDLPGVGMMIAALILFVYGFTQAPMEGWSSATFIAPFVVSIVLMAGFIIYERFLPIGYSLLPHDIWSYPNIFPLLLQASAIFMWMATAQLRLATYFQTALGDSPILAAVKLLPMGITALIVGTATQAMPWLITRPRYVQPIASALCFAGSMLFAFSNGGPGNDYWRYLFPGQIIGTAGGMIIFISMNTVIIQSFPLAFAGIGGSFANVIFQIGGVIGIAVQAGLIATGNGTVQDWIGSRNGYFFTSGYVMATGIIFVLWYRQEKMPKHEGQVVAV